MSTTIEPDGRGSGPQDQKAPEGEIPSGGNDNVAIQDDATQSVAPPSVEGGVNAVTNTLADLIDRNI